MNSYLNAPWQCGEALSTALQYEDRLVTYSELLRLTGAVNEKLAASCPAVEDCVVGVIVDDPLNLIIAILGALDSGVIVVPIESMTPVERIREIACDSGMTVVLCERANRDGLQREVAGVNLIAVEDALGKGSAGCVRNPWNQLLLYTSGSTGKPKGVPLDGAMLAGEGRKTGEILRIGPEDRVSHVLSPALLSGLRELLGGLFCGCTIVILPARMLSSEELARKLSEERVTVCRMVATLFRNLSSYLKPELTQRMRVVYFGGEMLRGIDVQMARRCFPGATRLINGFGASEFGWCTALEITPALSFSVNDVVPIGYALGGYRLTVVDSNGRELADGSEGCLVVEGNAVVPGYWKEGAEGGSRFGVSGAGPGWRRFLTADVVRRSSDGCFSFIGRSDLQVKLNGQRVELSDIEQRCKSHPCVSECCALIFESNGRQRLAAAVCLNQEVKDTQLLDAGTLRSYLGRFLPTHMLPTAFLFPESMPLTGSGKIDRHALRLQFAAAPSNEPKGVPPDTWEEQDLLVIWRKVLQLPNLGVTDHFFESGGDSLLAAGLSAEIARTMGVEFSMATLLAAPTVRQLAKELTKERARDQNTYCYQAKDGSDDRTVIAIGMRVERLLDGLSLSPDTQIWCVKYPGTQLYVPDGRIDLGALARNFVSEWTASCEAKRPVVIGFSFGATLAYALACELAGQGREPSCVLLEPGTPPSGRKKTPRPQVWWRYLREPAKLPARAGMALRKLGLARKPSAAAADNPAGAGDRATRLTPEQWMDLSGAERWILFGDEYRRSIASHPYRPFGGLVTVVGRPVWKESVEPFWTRLAPVSWHLTPEADEHEDMLRDDILDQCFALIEGMQPGRRALS